VLRIQVPVSRDDYSQRLDDDLEATSENLRRQSVDESFQHDDDLHVNTARS